MPAVPAVSVNWFARTAEFLGGFPDDYLVLDVETNGVDPRSERTLITQIGWARVASRKVRTHGELVLDWTRPGYGVDADELASSLAATRAGMARKGAAYHTTLEVLRTEGVEPRDALAACGHVVRDAAEAGWRFVGFNFWGFDRPLIESHLRRHAGAPFRFEDARVLDLGMIEKARVLRLFPPDPGSQPACRWYDHVRDDPRRVKWSLSGHCNAAYNLGVDAAQAHGALYDVMTTHRLLEAMRTLSET